jgi:putative endonuclease
MFYVYLLHSESDSGLDIGYSADLRRRLGQHKEGASQATSFRGPWNLIYYEAHIEEAGAIGRERYLKSGAGHKLIRSQLRNYFAKHPLRTAWDKAAQPAGLLRG